MSVADLSPAMRAFLLIKNPDGSAPRRLRNISASFYSLMLPTAESTTAQMAHYVLNICEAIALLAGLTLMVPLSLRTPMSSKMLDWQTTEWSAVALDTCAVINICTLVMCVVSACGGAIFTVFADEASFFGEILPLLGGGCVFWVLSINLLQVTIGLHLYHTTSSPWLAGGVCIGMYVACAFIVDRLHRGVLARRMPLELLHLPRWYCLAVAIMCPTLAPIFLRNREALFLDAAKERAAKLICRAGLEVPAEHMAAGKRHVV